MSSSPAYGRPGAGTWGDGTYVGKAAYLSFGDELLASGKPGGGRLVGLLGGFYVLIHNLAARATSRERVGQTIGALQAIQMACLALIPPVAGLAIDRWGLRSSFLLARPDPVPETADSLPWTDRTVRLVA